MENKKKKEEQVDVQPKNEVKKEIEYNAHLDKEIFEDIENGIVYLPLGCIIDERLERKIKIKKMKARDRLEMSRKKSQKNPMKTFDLILNRCVLEIGDKPATSSLIQSFSTGDRDTLFLALRRYSIGDTMVYKTKCGAVDCGEELEIELSLSDIPIKQRKPENYIIKDGRNFIKVKNEKLGISLEMRVPDNNDFQALKKYVLDQDPELDYQLYKRCLTKWNDKEGPFGIDFVLDFDIPEIKWIEDIVRELPGPNWDFNITCDFCGSVGKVNLGNIDFLS